MVKFKTVNALRIENMITSHGHFLSVSCFLINAISRQLYSERNLHESAQSNFNVINLTAIKDMKPPLFHKYVTYSYSHKIQRMCKLPRLTFKQVSTSYCCQVAFSQSAILLLSICMFAT